MDLLIIVTDASARGVRVTDSILGVIRRDDSMRHTRTGLVINRLKGDDKLITQSAEQWGIEILGRVPEDENITKFDSSGKPLIGLPATSPSVSAVRGILQKVDHLIYRVDTRQEKC